MSRTSLNQEFVSLESKLQMVISLCKQLRHENEHLKMQQNELLEERARLIEKNDLARAKVEQMILRLKAMEANQ